MKLLAVKPFPQILHFKAQDIWASEARRAHGDLLVVALVQRWLS